MATGRSVWTPPSQEIPFYCGFRRLRPGFRLNAAMRSDRRRPPVPIEGGRGALPGVEELTQVFLVASSLARWAAILRMLSPLPCPPCLEGRA